MGKVTFVLGLPGVGKTTLLKNAQRHLDSQYYIRNFGDVMAEIGRKRGVLTQESSIQKIPRELHKELQLAAARFFAQIAEGQDVIVDSHSVIETSHGYMPGLPMDVLSEVKPDLLILIEESPEEILERRKRDARERNTAMELSELELHQQMSRLYAVVYSVLSGALLRILRNREHELEESAHKLAEFLQPSEFRCY